MQSFVRDPDRVGAAATGHGVLRAEVLPSVEAIGEGDWNRLFGGTPEDWAFLRSAEESPLAGTSQSALVVRDGRGATIAAAPLFALSYRLDTSLTGRLRALADRASRAFPGSTELGVVGLGSPLSDWLGLGFGQSLDSEGRGAALAKMLDELRAEAGRRGANVITLKSLPEPEPALHDVLVAHGFARVRSVPVVMLDLPFATLDDYLQSLPAKTRSYLKRKRRSEAGLRFERRTTTDGIEGEIDRLYGQTLAQSGSRYGELDRLPAGLIEGILRRQRDNALLVLAWQGEKLLSFQLSIVGAERLLAYKIGMQYPEAREQNLYFINWLKMIEFAIAHRIPAIEMGATAWSSKLLFGGRLERRWLYWRFRRRLSNALLRPLGRFFDFESNDRELARLEEPGGSAPHAAALDDAAASKPLS